MSDLRKILYDVDYTLWLHAYSDLFKAKRNNNSVRKRKGGRPRTASIDKETAEGKYDYQRGNKLYWRNFSYHWIKLNVGGGKFVNVPAKGGVERKEGSASDRKEVHQISPEEQMRALGADEIMDAKKTGWLRNRYVIHHKKFGEIAQIQQVKDKKGKKKWQIESVANEPGKKSRKTKFYDTKEEAMGRALTQFWRNRYENKHKDSDDQFNVTQRVRKWRKDQEQEQKAKSKKNKSRSRTRRKRNKSS